MSENWIRKALPPSSRGKLHKKLDVKKGEKIPASKIEKATKSKSPTLRKKATLAQTLSKLRKK